MTRLVEEVEYPAAVDIRTEFTQILTDIETEMSEVLNERGGPARPLYEMLAYHLGLDGNGESGGGKRIRPLLGVLAYQSLGGDYRKALPGAAAVELGHNFSLVHDDIEDADRERRHRPTLWALWGVPLAINAGGSIFFRANLDGDAADDEVLFLDATLVAREGDPITTAFGTFAVTLQLVVSYASGLLQSL